MIIFLNGCSSSGKTSIAKAIGRISNDLWLVFGVDTFIEMIPASKQEAYFKFIPSHNERGALMHIKSESEAKKLFGIMPQFAEMLVAKGNNIIIDEVLLDEVSLRAYAKQLMNYIVFS